MRKSAIFAFVVAILCARGAISENCFTQSGGNIKINRACTSGKAKLLSKSGEFTIDFSGDAGDVPSAGRLHFEGCDMELKMGKLFSDTTFKVNDKSIDLPAVATVKEGSVIFKDKQGIKYTLPSCSPIFNKVEEGRTIYVDYSMSSPDLRMLFNGVSLYPNSEKKRSLSTSMKVLLGVLGLIVFLCGSGVVGFFLLRWFSKRQERLKQPKDKGETAMKKQSKEEVATKKPTTDKKKDVEKKLEKADVKKVPEKPKAKKTAPILKQVDETQSFEEIPVVKQEVTRKQDTNAPSIKPGPMPKNSPIPSRKPKVRFSPEVNVEFISTDMPSTAKQDVKDIRRRLSSRSISPANNTTEEWQACQKAKSGSMVEEMRISEHFSEEEDLETARSP